MGVARREDRQDNKRYGNGASPFGFEDLDVYQVASRFRRRTYRLARALPPEERFALAQQMRRAAVSVTSNIAEGHGRHHWQENAQFSRQSRGSLMELVDAINVCREQKYISQDDWQQARQEAVDVLRLLNGYIAYLLKQKKR